ncbi:FAD-dependent oxidoreductase, partial [Shewanella sp.]|uniref:FAD-dependent oxidoreductase n=1 Tax=Shewanella sp. TaxID=50422 RepID=UPI00257F16A8
METTQAPTATLEPYQQIRLGDKPFGRQICLAAVGSEALLPLLQLWSQLRQDYPKLVLQLLLFAADKDSRAESLKVLQSKLPLGQTTEATASAEHQTSEVISLLAELQAGKPLAIPGCQRFVLDGGRLTLDLYLEFDATLLKELPGVNHNGWIDNWLWLAEPLPSQAEVWQMARLAKDYASLLCLPSKRSALASIMVNSGLNIVDFNGPAALLLTQQTELEPIAKAERLALRRQSNARLAPWPLYRESTLAADESIAIIGAGVAGSQLALSLAERHQPSQVFCSEENAGQSASGNRQGALYPLLTPETSELNTLFQQGFLFSRRRITALVAAGFDIAHDFCGVLHTGFDERSRTRLNKIAEGQNWHPDILRRVNNFEATELAGLDIKEDGLFYPLGGWVCPRALCRAA